MSLDNKLNAKKCKQRTSLKPSLYTTYHEMSSEFSSMSEAISKNCQTIIQPSIIIPNIMQPNITRNFDMESSYMLSDSDNNNSIINSLEFISSTTSPSQNTNPTEISSSHTDNVNLSCNNNLISSCNDNVNLLRKTYPADMDSSYNNSLYNDTKSAEIDDGTDLNNSSLGLDISAVSSLQISVGQVKHHRSDHTVDTKFLCERSRSYSTVESWDDNQRNVNSKGTTISPTNKDSDCENRRNINSKEIRISLANRAANADIILRPMNFCERYVNMYRKGLHHDLDGFVDNDMMGKLIQALEQRDNKLLSQVGNKVRLVNPSAAWSLDLFGQCNNTYRYSKTPTLRSNIIAAEMTGLYCMSLARDIPFNQYRVNPIIRECCEYLNSLEKYPYGPVNVYNIFRGPMYGDLQGSYVSQFLYRDINMGGFPQAQKYPTYLMGHDFMKRWSTAISVQNGNVSETLASQRNSSRYLITGRDLACYVHHDEPFQAFYNACVILMDMNVPMNPGIMKLLNSNKSEGHFVNFGKPDIQSSISMVGRNALLATWYIKWNSMFLRPEAFGIEVERVFMDKHNKYGISPELLRNPVLSTIRSLNGNVLLSQVYPEGSPLHPSTPSHHAAIAGACVTVLKFFFDANHEIEVYEPDIDGQNLINTGKRSTVGDELNKLASNISFGRNWAGVHYHMDATRGMKLGQSVAISCLQDLIQRYPVPVDISFHKFNGKVAIITNKLG